MRGASFVAAAAAALLSTAQALNPIEVKGQDFVDSVTGNRFEIIGVDYQPGGSAAYNPSLGFDPLSNGKKCLRDAIMMQRLGINTIRVYSVDPALNHDECVSIFNAAGMYIIMDVNSPLPNESINQLDPASSYNLDYIKRTFAVIDAFRNYPNVLGFFSGNEVVNDNVTSKHDPPYIRAVQRDLKQYIAARGGRPLAVGYSAADVRDQLVDIAQYLTCHMNNDDKDYSRIDFFGLNSYSWCGDATFVSSTYNQLVAYFSNNTTPVFFSEFGCKDVLPRQFTEIDALYGNQMTTWSGGLVYEWTEEPGNAHFGLVTVNSDDSLTLLGDYNTLMGRYSNIDLGLILKANNTANNLKPPTCAAGLINPPFDQSFDLPAQPSGVAALISSGGAGKTGNIISVTSTAMPYAVTAVGGSSTLSNLVLTMASSANVPGASGQSGAGGSSPSSSSNAAALPTGLVSGVGSVAAAVVVVEVLVQMF